MLSNFLKAESKKNVGIISYNKMSKKGKLTKTVSIEEKDLHIF